KTRQSRADISTRGNTFFLSKFATPGAHSTKSQPDRLFPFASSKQSECQDIPADARRCRDRSSRVLHDSAFRSSRSFRRSSRQRFSPFSWINYQKIRSRRETQGRTRDRKRAAVNRSYLGGDYWPAKPRADCRGPFSLTPIGGFGQRDARPAPMHQSNREPS